MERARDTVRYKFVLAAIVRVPAVFIVDSELHVALLPQLDIAHKDGEDLSLHNRALGTILITLHKLEFVLLAVEV